MLSCELCPRGLKDCNPLSNMATEDGKDFVCVGKSDPKTRSIHQDKFRHCFVNDNTDTKYDYDEYDIMSVISVMSEAILTENHLT